MKGGRYGHLAVTFATCGYRLRKRPASSTSHRGTDVQLSNLDGNKAKTASEVIHREVWPIPEADLENRRRCE